MDSENFNIWYILLPLLVGIICGVLGYLFGKNSAPITDHSAEFKIWKEKNAKLQADLDACNKKLIAKPSTGVSSSANKTASDVSSAFEFQITEPVAFPFDAEAAKVAFGKKVKQDDLKMIEGIGPKIEAMFKKAGIKTWENLSETSVASCQEVLNGGGNRYKIHDPASWPMQAKMCYEGKWPELFKWQEDHDHGKL